MNQPQDEEPIVAELNEAPPAAMSTIPVQHDSWCIERLNGERLGPLTWQELVGCVNSHLLQGGDQAYGELNARRRLYELFPAFYAQRPTVQQPVEPMLSPAEQFARSPGAYLLFGPELPPFEKADPMGRFFATKMSIIGAVAALAFVLIVLLIWLAAQGTKQQKGAAIAFVVLGSLMFLAGIFGLSGSLLEWEFFFSGRKAKFWRIQLGDQGARYFLVGVSCVFLALALALYAIGIAAAVI